MFTFKRALPETEGVSSRAIMDTLKELDAKNVPMHSFLIMKNDALIFEKYYAPYHAKRLHRMFSITKSFTAIAIALLEGEGRIRLDDPITDYFPEYVKKDTHPWIMATTIRNMLMMRTCHASTTYKVDMTSDWVESFFTVPPTHKPGTVFHYDTSAAHVLCALVEKLSGMDILDYMKDRLLRHVDFSSDSYVVKDPFGVSIGGSGLMATPMDIMKFLYILSRKGTITCSDGVTRTLVSPEFIEMATSNLSDTCITGPLPSECQGYGMQIWQNEKGGFVLYGMGGQLAISLPDENMLIVTTADTQGMQGGNQIIYNAIYGHLVGDSMDQASIENSVNHSDDSVNLTENTPAPSASRIKAPGSSDYDELISYADTLRISPPRLPANYLITNTYNYRSNIPGCVKSMTQSSYSGDSSDAKDMTTLNYKLTDNPQGFESLSLSLSKSSPCSIEIRKKESLHTICFGLQSMCEGSFPIYDTPYTAGGIWLRDNVLYVRIHLIGECVGSVHFQFYFGEKDITVFMRKIEETYFKEFEGHLYGVLSDPVN